MIFYLKSNDYILFLQGGLKGFPVVFQLKSI